MEGRMSVFSRRGTREITVTEPAIAKKLIQDEGEKRRKFQ